MVSQHSAGEETRDGQDFTIYYDGACPLCKREIAGYQKLDGASDIDWLDVTRCDAERLGGDLNRDAALARMHVRDTKGQLLSGAAAFAAMWKQFPRTRWLGRVASLKPVLWILEPAYRLFLKIRPMWRS